MTNEHSVAEEGSLSTKSKADLLALIGEMNERHTSLVARFEAKRAELGEALAKLKPLPAAEAVALADCMRALDALEESERRRSGSSNLGSYFKPGIDFGPIERVLRHLAEKFGVRLIQTEVKECDRDHLDQIDPQSLVAALATAQKRWDGLS